MQPDITGAIEAAAWKRENAKWDQAFADDAIREDREKREARDENEIKCAASVVKCANLRRGVIESLRAAFPEVEHNGRGEWWQVGPYIVAAWIGDNGLPYAAVEHLSLEEVERLGGARRMKTRPEDVGTIGEFRKPARIAGGWIRVDVSKKSGQLLIDTYAQYPRY